MSTNAAGGEQPVVTGPLSTPAAEAPAAAEPAGYTPPPGSIPPPAPSGIDPQTAVTFYQSLADPTTREQALERTLQSYGVLPQGASLNQLRSALELQQQIPDGVPVEELLGYAQEYAAYQQNPFGQPAMQDPGQQQYAPQPQPFDPEQVRGWMDQQIQQGIQAAMQQQAAQQAQAEFQGALATSFQSAVQGMTPEQARHFEWAVVGRANAHTAEGGQVNAAVAAQIVNEVRQGLAGFAPIAGAEQVAQQNAVTPQTTAPQGIAPGGNPPRPGLDGSADMAYEKLRQMGYNVPQRG